MTHKYKVFHKVGPLEDTAVLGCEPCHIKVCKIIPVDYVMVIKFINME